MLALIFVVAVFAGARADVYHGKPVACCHNPQQFIEDSKNKCAYWECTKDLYDGFKPTLRYCAPGTGVPDGYSKGYSNPCTEHTNYCYRVYELYYPYYCNPHPPTTGDPCYDCNAEIGGSGGTQACLLPSEGAGLDLWPCKGKCYIRYEETKPNYYNGYVSKKYIYRGCTSALSPVIDVNPAQNCKLQQGLKYWFCKGKLCNTGKPCGY